MTTFLLFFIAGMQFVIAGVLFAILATLQRDVRPPESVWPDGR